MHRQWRECRSMTTLLCSSQSVLHNGVLGVGVVH